ncbi:MAG: hypothetical protein HQK99_12730 [Nitrospirae bacterium]|nr:hypothetical protein [Nitrospirota bacterium]
MTVITVPKPLREKLGDEAADSLIKIINETELTSRKDLATREDIFKLSECTKEDIFKLSERTREDIFKLSERMTKMEGELILIKWMMGIMLAGVISLVMKAFFMH